MQVLFPQTRYQGSKLKLLDWFQPIFHNIEFDTVLDAFGGTSAVSHMFKRMGKEVTYNDILTSNWYIGKALIENNSTKFDLLKVRSLFEKKKGFSYLTTIQDQFQDIYYIDKENELLDIVVQNIFRLENQFEKAICFFALFQACIQKRPFNLFHRKNLYLRLNKVERSFGNKKTWDTPFEQLFLKAIKEGNHAVFDNQRVNKAFNYPILDLPLPDEGYDLVYLDPPYVSSQGIGIDYRDFYHFLEGICNYDCWESMIDYESKHRRLKIIHNGWTSPKKVLQEFEKTIEKFRDYKMIISYRDPGIPDIDTIKKILLSYKKNIIVQTKDYKYALTSTKKTVKEVIFLSKN
ncbi:MAG: DNA adenine methylase [Promethearchaeota archaeon]